MKRLRLCIFLSSFIALGLIVYAHPPTDISITYDVKNKTLEAVIAHPVSNPQAHFINKVNILLNGQVIIEHRISRQDNNTKQTVIYVIPDAGDGSVLTVEAYCSISGKLKKEVKITE
ncbi:MAG: hypothetical protein NC923_07845 [Candidatus Omnitrophica bacterium]|nr:hypothetical protein [Candidatus Omnitrophota bacterium]